MVSVHWPRIVPLMGDQSAAQPAERSTSGSEDWDPPWKYCTDEDQVDRDGRKGATREGFDGTKPHDSSIVYWSRRVQRRLDALTPWAQFGYLCTLKLCGPRNNPSWRYTLPKRQRARYYAEDYYVLLTTALVVLWACLTAGLMQVSDSQKSATAWILITLIPGFLLLVLYVWASKNKGWVTFFWTLGLAAIVVLPVVFGLGEWVRWFVPWPLVVRAAELLLMLVKIISFDTLARGYMHTRISRVKYLYYAILYVVQASFIYTAIYAFWVPGGFYNPSNCTSTAFTVSCSPVTVTGLNNYIYLSVMTLTTLGSGFQPASWLAQWLQMSEVGLGILLLAVGLATFVGSLQLISLEDTQRQESCLAPPAEKSACTAPTPPTSEGGDPHSR